MFPVAVLLQRVLAIETRNLPKSGKVKSFSQKRVKPCPIAASWASETG